MNWKDLCKAGHNIVFVGESGCGKTELSIHCSIQLTENSNWVNLIGMDQTKGVFRARDFKEFLGHYGVSLLNGEHYLDSPVVPPGVERLLSDVGQLNVMDVGGNEIGALTMGQFSDVLNREGVTVFFVVNPFRILSTDAAHVMRMMEDIRTYGRFREFRLVGNPNLGAGTCKQDVIDGIAQLEMIAEKASMDIAVVAVPVWLKQEIDTAYPVTYINPVIQYP